MENGIAPTSYFYMQDIATASADRCCQLCGATASCTNWIYWAEFAWCTLAEGPDWSALPPFTLPTVVYGTPDLSARGESCCATRAAWCLGDAAPRAACACLPILHLPCC